MDCPKCKSANPDGKRYCSDCGASLDAIDDEFRRRVEAIFREQLRDQKMVEIETADAVLLRLKTWAKPFIYAVAVLAAVLGLLGFRSMKDAVDAMKSAQQQALQALRLQASTESQSLAHEAESIRAQFRKVGDQSDLVQKRHDAESQLTALQAAGRRLKERYETVSSELAHRVAGGGSGGEGKVGKNVGMTLGDNSGQQQASHYFATGSSGQDVERIQSRLHELGCYSGAVTGDFDAPTKNAVERFNAARGDPLAISVVDPPTWNALFSKTSATRCR